MVIVIVTNSELINPLDIQQLKWALRTGNMEVLENDSAENQQIATAEFSNNVVENPPVYMTVLAQIKNMENMMNQEFTLLRNEFAVFIQAQDNRENALILSETEWKQKLVDHESKMLAELWEMRQSIIVEYTTYFQLIVEQFENRDHAIQQEFSLIKKQLTEIHQYQEYHKEQELLLANERNQKVEACQRQLIDCMQHIQGVLEEISAHGIAIQKQDNFFCQEIAIVKCELANLRQAWQFREGKPIIIEVEDCDVLNNSQLSEKEIDVKQGLQVEQDQNKRKKRRHRRG